ncbi:hypothetical protein M0813_18187 [Anaeramoeba flamelloides]|uniref:Uncharacterized protein n=1 Tax=Anaeramoeba flamelloides TaxID=1746091 RepID=A0ABQ8YTS8_9EUKA|nr:hypothetical protein M0813_18187 [Anaeramoeba flamelloides]
MSTQIRESSSVTNCNTLENDIHSVNAIETIEEEEKKMSWGDLIIEELGREDSLKYHEENPKIKTQFLSIDYLRKNLILKPDHGSDPNNKNFSPQQFTSLKNFENKVLNNLEEDEIPICISFFYDHHEVNKNKTLVDFIFLSRIFLFGGQEEMNQFFLISNILEEFNFYSYQHLLNLQKELLSLKQGFIFEKQKYKVFFLKFYSDSKEINQAVGRKDPNAHNQCPYCDQVSIPKKNLQNNEYYSSKIKRHKRNVEEFKENWKKLKNSKNPKEARKIAKKFKDNAILKQKVIYGLKF